MFGYITINKAEMKFKEFDVYHSYYCGLCRSLKKRYGALGQISLSYDFTFILMLLSSLYEPETKVNTCKCIAHPFEKHETRYNEITDYAADMNVLFTRYKCLDDWEDEKKLFRLVYSNILEGKSKRYREFYEKKIKTIELLMQNFYDCEKTKEADADKMAGLFGQIMGEIIAMKDDEWNSSLKNFGFYLGKFIYLLDAYEDIGEDIKKGRFNPLKDQYESIEFEDNIRTVLTMIITDCCKEFEQLPIVENIEILRNILYSGIWTRYELVNAKRKNKSEKK